MKKEKSLCAGCRCDFYNDHNGIGVKECMHYKSAKVIKKDVYLTKNSKKPTTVTVLQCFSMQY